MAKRAAQSQLTKENCLNEDEAEDAGHFEKAGPAKLQNREIKKAKRRLPENGVASSPFSQFKGFVGASTPTFPQFSFQAKPPASNGSNVSLESPKETVKASPAKLLPKSDIFLQSNPATRLSAADNSKSASENNFNGKLEQNKLEQFKELNLAFVSWVQEHMKKNAYCDFTPVCVDYMEHMKKLQKVPDSTVLPVKTDTTSKPDLACQTSFKLAAKVSSAKSAETEADDDNYVPPKNEFKPVTETDFLYSKRCKLFFKKDENFVEKGVGTLYFKVVDGRNQLLVRADNNLGLILLNVSANESLPTQRLGKNNVLISCIPHPPIDPKAKPEPTPMLFRVKTSEDADELLEKLNKFKTTSRC